MLQTKGALSEVCSRPSGRASMRAGRMTRRSFRGPCLEQVAHSSSAQVVYIMSATKCQQRQWSRTLPTLCWCSESDQEQKARRRASGRPYSAGRSRHCRRESEEAQKCRVRDKSLCRCKARSSEALTWSRHRRSRPAQRAESQAKRCSLLSHTASAACDTTDCHQNQAPIEHGTTRRRAATSSEQHRGAGALQCGRVCSSTKARPQ